MKRIFVSLPDGVWNIMKKDYLGKVGDSESEVVRNIIIAYLSEHGYFVNLKGTDDAKEIKDKLIVAETLIESIIDALEEKGHLTFEDVDKIMKKRIAKMTSSRS